MSFDKRFTEVILSKYKNISEFIESTGLSRTQIDLYAKGKTVPSIKKVEELAEVLSVSPAWLAYGVEKHQANNEENEIIDIVNLINRRLDIWLKENKKKMDLDKKSILVKIIYKKLQLNEMKGLSGDKLNESIGDLIEFYSAA